MSKWRKKIEELADKIDGGLPHNPDFPTTADLIEGLLYECAEDTLKQVIEKGMGDPPVSTERLGEIVATINPYDSYSSSAEELLSLVEFLQARIALLAKDNESWNDGYTQGIREGKRRCLEVVKDEKPSWASDRVHLIYKQVFKAVEKTDVNP